MGNWKRVSGVLCWPKNTLEGQGKSIQDGCKTSNMMYDAETWAAKKAQEKKLDVAEMRMLRWMSGVTKLDRIRNERIRGTTKVGEIYKKVQESRLKWYGHVLRREEEYVGKRVMAMEVPGKRRGTPKRRWLDNIKNDLSERKLSGEEVQDRIKLRRLIINSNTTSKWKNDAEEYVGYEPWLSTTLCIKAGRTHTRTHNVIMLGGRQETQRVICDSPLRQVVEVLPQGQHVVVFATCARVDASALHATAEAADRRTLVRQILSSVHYTYK